MVEKMQNTKMKKRKRCCTHIALFTVGTFLISLGITLFFNNEHVYDWILNTAMTFNEDSTPFKVWRINDPPLPLSFYLFNWTNPEDIYNPDIKPRFQEVGPYRFKEVKEKVNITWHDNNTISFKHRKFYYYDAENSERDMSQDVINIINPVPLTIAYKARFYSYFSKRGISLSMNAMTSIYVTKTVKEILFDGYADNILSIASSLPFSEVTDKFGLFYKRNGTIGLDGIFSMYTKNDDKFGKLMSWNYKNETNFYKGKCNDISASAGEFYPLNRKRDAIRLFNAELCKVAHMEYDKDVVIKGVHGYKYTGKNLFDNGTNRGENSCFCNGECIPSGVLNVSTCREDAPIFLSLPHFFNADPYYTDIIDGMDPQEDKHEFYLTLEPKSAITFDVAARMQMNMLLQPIEDINMYENVPRVFMPLFYFNQELPVSDELANDLVMLQSLPEKITIASVILIALGLLCFVWLLCSLFCCSRTKDKYPENYKIPHAFEEIPLRS